MTLQHAAPAPVTASGPPPDAAPARTGPAPVVHRARIVAACLALTGLAFSQRPGEIVADTKIDLAVDPVAFLGRALRLWEPEGFAGQVQNQAYGYLFPMGPFFAVGRTAGLPEWVVQRAWIAVLLCLAFLGATELARRLRVGTPATWLLAGLVYALAPRMVSSLGAISVEVLPMAMAPWVLIPLVAGAHGGSPRRATALSGLAVFCVGGVNAAATAAVLPLAALYLLTRRPGPRRRRLIAWWSAAVVLATAWWASALLLLGRYSPPFLDQIESAATTTGPTQLVQALRGTTQWIAHLATPYGPLWPAGWALVHDLLPVLATVALAAAGLAGLARRGMPERSWLALGALTGLVLVTAGHVASVDGLLAPWGQAALDGPLAPLRNVHKFDPVLRLPLALGLAHLVAVGARRLRERAGTLGTRAVPLLAVLAVLAVASPALAGRLAPATGFDGLPGYWSDTARWLSDTAPTGRALLVPGSSFGVYAWGSPADEPLQPLADSAWDVRNAVPLTPSGHTRMLDAVESSLARGEGSAGLASYLARAGFTHLVLRNDLDTGAAGSTRPALVRQALDGSPGLAPVAGFGPTLFTTTAAPGLVQDGGTFTPAPAIEIYAVADPAPRAWTAPLADAVTVAGGPDGVLALAERDLLDDRPALLDDGADAELVSDALLRRERTFGRITDASSAGLDDRDPLRLDGPARDYLLPDQEAHESTVRYTGGIAAASSSASDPDSGGGSDPAAHPFAALDGDPATAWRPAAVYGGTDPRWWRVEADRPFSADAVTVTLGAGSYERAPSRLRVSTDTGEVLVPLDRTAAPQRLSLPAGRTRSLTLTAPPDESGAVRTELSLAEVSVPGVSVSRTVVAPRPDGPVRAWVFDATDPATGGCVAPSGGDVRCVPGMARPSGEPAGLDRTFSLVAPQTYAVSATTVPRPGPALDALLADADPAGLRATASSRAVPDTRSGPGAAVDGDPATAGRAGPDDPEPTLRVELPAPRTVDRIRIVGAAATATPTAVTVTAGAEERTVFLDSSGTARFAPLRTDSLTLRFPLAAPVASADPYTRAITPVGVGVSEVEIPGTAAVDPSAVVDLPCGAAPALMLDGVALPTAARATVAQLRSGRPVDLVPCTDPGTVTPGAGTHRLVAASTDVASVTSATLSTPGSAGAPVRRTAVATPVWEAEHRRAELPARSEPTLLVVPENANPGWSASIAGTALEARTVDGWQQAYVVPAGPAATVELEFGPGPAYRTGLAAGLLAVLVLIGLALVPARGPVPGRTGPRAGTGAVTAAAAVTALALTTGWVGLLVLALLAPAAVLIVGRRRRGAVLGSLAATALLTAGAVLWATGSAGTATQVLCAVAVAALVTAHLPTRRRPT